MEIRGKKNKLVKYWDIHDETSSLRKKLKNISFKEAKEELFELLIESAKYNLISDVPVGAFLSGGIDSTVVTGLMGEISPNKVKAFSVGFDKKSKIFDEREYARLAAKHLDCELEEIILSSQSLLDIFPKVISDIDQPSFDGTNTWIVSRATSQSTKVAVSGLGGDELLAGYNHFGLMGTDDITIPLLHPMIIYLIERLHYLRPNYISEKLLFKMYSKPESMQQLGDYFQNWKYNLFLIQKLHIQLKII